MMTKTRALKDVARDPLVKTEPSLPQTKKTRSGWGNCAVTLVLGIIAGLVGGFVSSRFLKIRF
jgi:tetrahydromethanopterin S-methyltransferase subunit D